MEKNKYNYDNYNNYPYSGYNNNNNFNNNHRNNEDHINLLPDPFRLLQNKVFKNRMKKGKIIWPGMFNIKDMKYKKMIYQARKTYNLEGVQDNQLIDALNKTNGNIDEAVILLTK